jgi:hypothetical protein
VNRRSAHEDGIGVKPFETSFECGKTLRLEFSDHIFQPLRMGITGRDFRETQLLQVRYVTATYGSGPSNQRGFYRRIRQGSYFAK